jgi:hypothetical protein
MGGGEPVAGGRRPAVRLAALLLLIVSGAGACTGRGDDGADDRSGTQDTAQTVQGYTGPAIRGDANPIGLKWDWPGLDRYLPFVKSLSGGATFYEFEWCQIEPRAGQRDWSALDEVVGSSRRLGYGLLLKIRVGSCWVTGGRRGEQRGAKRKTVSAMPQDLDAYRAFVRDVVTRYGKQGVREYAIENEVNARNFWDGTPEQFEQLSRAGAEAVRDADPKAQVLDGGIASPVYGLAVADRLLAQGRSDEAVAAYQRYYGRRGSQFEQVTSEDALRRALAEPLSRRALAYLAATQRLARDGVIDAYQLHFYEPWENVPALLTYLRETLPADLPIEAWEVGMFWRGGPQDQRGDQQLRADEATKVVALLLAGGVRRVTWLPLAVQQAGDGEGEGELRFGLLDDNGAVRPAGEAVRSVAAAAAGSVWRALPSPTVSGVAFGKQDSTTLVLWSEGSATVPGPPPAGAKATAVSGAPVAWGRSGLNLGSEPVLVSIALPLDNALDLVR